MSPWARSVEVIAAIVLAAGESRRMGTQKLLLPYAGRTVIEHIVRELQAGGARPIIVVTGKDRDPVEACVVPLGAVTVHNPDYPEGMLTSVRAGLRALPDECEAVLVALGDQPAIRSDTVARLCEGFSSGIAVPVFDGQRGHPILFSTMYRDEVLEQHDDVGLRGLLHAHAGEIHEIAVDTPTVLRDMDTPEDYRRELGALE